jgi:peptidoglycan/LPS O-acetylase OafA/YrhL
MLTNQKYRADIDGLRAIAVLSVVIYHAFPALLPGGFIGVDVFFVISGYLITGILLKELESGTFSIFKFYLRRIRRIFPALLLVLAACLIVGWYVLFDDELKALGKHVFAGAGFISNIALWREVGYFDAAAETKPLLHLWSLGIEEQFYLFWPIALWVGFRCRKVAVWGFALLIALSLYASAVKVSTDPTAAFYSPLTRFWELALGGALAYLHAGKAMSAHRLRWTQEVSAVGGMLLLAAGLVLIDKTRSFPGLWALLPVGASLLLIGPGRNSWINRPILSNRLAVWVGLISFPLYLWHWPIMSFSTIVSSQFAEPWYRAGAVALSVALAWITYKVVETPVRKSRTNTNAAVLAVMMVMVAALGISVFRGTLFDLRQVSPMAQDMGHTRFFDYMKANFYPCADEGVRAQSETYEIYTRCMQSRADKDVDVAIIGDSHGEHLFVGLAKAMDQHTVAYYIQSSPPYLSNPRFKYIFDYVKDHPSIKKVLITMHWIQRIDEIPAGSTLEAEVYSTVEYLESLGKEVYLVDDVPRFPFGPQDCVSRVGTTTRHCSIPFAQASKELDAYKAQLVDVAKRDVRVKYIPVSQYLCNADDCTMVKDAQLLYRDNNHLNVHGSSMVGKLIVRDNPELLSGFDGS